MRFHLETAIAAWRRTLENTRDVTREDLRELECHVRDQVDWLQAEGLTQEAALRRALRDAGDYGTTETEFHKVYWAKRRHRRQLNEAVHYEIAMFRNNVKVALRNLLKTKGNAFINVFGLAVGIAASLLIFQYVTYELSYDDFLDDGDRIYRVEYDQYQNGELIFKSASAFPGVGPAMKDDFPEVEEFARLYSRWNGGVVRIDDRSYKEEWVYQADSLFLQMFSYPMLRGDRSTALNEPNTAVITAEAAARYFGDEDPMGKSFRFRNDEEYTITGVVEQPENSHLKFDFLLSWATLRQQIGSDFDTAWGWYDFYIFVRLRADADAAALEAKLPDFIDRHTSGNNPASPTVFLLQPVRSIHLHSDLVQEARVNGDATSVYVLAVIAFFILGIALVNYVNLATARSMERAREIGVRKVMGAHRRQLVRQFLLESSMLIVVSAVLALGLTAAALPLFRSLTGSTMELSLLGDARLWAVFGLLVVVGALLAGLYPAFVVSSYRPVHVLKGSFTSTRQGTLLRRVLVVGQFVASVALIAATIGVYRQVSFMRSQSLGVDVERTIVAEGPGILPGDSLAITSGINGFKQELLARAEISSVATSTQIPGNLIIWTNGIRRLDQQPGEGGILYRIGVDYDFLPSYGHRVVAGRLYSRDFTVDANGVIMNETAVRRTGLGTPEEAIGRPVRVGGDTLTVVGVVADYHQEGLQKAFDPIGFTLRPEAPRYLSIKVRGTDLQDSIGQVSAAFNRAFPGNPFNYFFLDDHFEAQYQAYNRFGRVFGVFAGLAILVACLGLFGLTSYTLGRRTKEIGIRKVLGSSVPSLLVILSRDILRLVAISAVIATPLVWYGLDRWLERFAFRTDIAWWSFLVAGTVAVLIAMGTVGRQTMRAASAEPARSLRYE